LFGKATGAVAGKTRKRESIEDCCLLERLKSGPLNEYCKEVKSFGEGNRRERERELVLRESLARSIKLIALDIGDWQ
jgi:hypothetical protein